jgi:hypothetical protein
MGLWLNSMKTHRKKLKEGSSVNDDGRNRFHGAFTGGFSAGYHNTVGSANNEGFQPKSFRSSRKQRASREHVQQRPEDFMDEEDGLLGAELTTNVAFTSQGNTINANEYMNSMKQINGDQLHSNSLVGGLVPDELRDVLSNQNQSKSMSSKVGIGMSLLNRMQSDENAKKSTNIIIPENRISNAGIGYNEGPGANGWDNHSAAYLSRSQSSSHVKIKAHAHVEQTSYRNKNRNSHNSISYNYGYGYGDSDDDIDNVYDDAADGQLPSSQGVGVGVGRGIEALADMVVPIHPDDDSDSGHAFGMLKPVIESRTSHTMNQAVAAPKIQQLRCPTDGRLVLPGFVLSTSNSSSTATNVNADVETSTKKSSFSNTNEDFMKMTITSPQVPEGFVAWHKFKEDITRLSQDQSNQLSNHHQSPSHACIQMQRKIYEDSGFHGVQAPPAPPVLVLKQEDITSFLKEIASNADTQQQHKQKDRNENTTKSSTRRSRFHDSDTDIQNNNANNINTNISLSLPESQNSNLKQKIIADNPEFQMLSKSFRNRFVESSVMSTDPVRAAALPQRTTTSKFMVIDFDDSTNTNTNTKAVPNSSSNNNNTITRNTSVWIPSPLLCKRMGIEAPSVSGSELQILPVSTSSYKPKQEQREKLEKMNTNTNTNTNDDSQFAYVENQNQNQALLLAETELHVYERPSDELFRAIFQSNKKIKKRSSVVATPMTTATTTAKAAVVVGPVIAKKANDSLAAGKVVYRKPQSSTFNCKSTMHSTSKSKRMARSTDVSHSMGTLSSSVVQKGVYSDDGSSNSDSESNSASCIGSGESDNNSDDRSRRRKEKKRRKFEKKLAKKEKKQQKKEKKRLKKERERERERDGER